MCGRFQIAAFAAAPQWAKQDHFLILRPRLAFFTPLSELGARQRGPVARRRDRAEYTGHPKQGCVNSICTRTRYFCLPLYLEILRTHSDWTEISKEGAGMSFLQICSP